jgi:hypothetical protein
MLPLTLVGRSADRVAFGRRSAASNDRASPRTAVARERGQSFWR